MNLINCGFLFMTFLPFPSCIKFAFARILKIYFHEGGCTCVMPECLPEKKKKDFRLDVSVFLILKEF